LFLGQIKNQILEKDPHDLNFNEYKFWSTNSFGYMRNELCSGVPFSVKKLKNERRVVTSFMDDPLIWEKSRRRLGGIFLLDISFRHVSFEILFKTKISTWSVKSFGISISFSIALGALLPTSPHFFDFKTVIPLNESRDSQPPFYAV
jgi:hypothetical protein